MKNWMKKIPLGIMWIFAVFGIMLVLGGITKSLFWNWVIVIIFTLGFLAYTIYLMSYNKNEIKIEKK